MRGSPQAGSPGVELGGSAAEGEAGAAGIGAGPGQGLDRRDAAGGSGRTAQAEHLDLDKAGAKLLFQIFHEREERRAIAITSNTPFSERKQTFIGPRLCTAIVDRVTFNAHIVETGTESYRFTQTQRS